jgi:hypothetical protein
VCALPFDKRSKRPAFDLIALFSRFKIGMTYDEVQSAMPASARQDAVSYNLADRVFLLSVEFPSKEKRIISFTFDTSESLIRRPERLIELRSTAMLSSRREPFDSIVQKVSRLLGAPAETARSGAMMNKAGWSISGESFLTLKYSIIPSGPISPDAVVEITVESRNRRKSVSPRA